MQTHDAQSEGESIDHGRRCCGGTCHAKVDPVALGVALLMAGVLGFAIFAKFSAPNPKELALDYTVGAIQTIVLIGMLAFYRRWWTWSALTVLWAGMAGWSFFKSWHGESCGCFSTLWEPPPYSTGILDSLFVLASAGISVRRGASTGVAVTSVVLAIAAGALGWVAAEEKTPPRRAETAQIHGGKEAKDRLLASDLMADIREQPAGGPAWLIFAHDPDCHICEGILPFMEFFQAGYEETGDPVMQIRMFSIPDLVADAGIETHAWETPTIFIVHSGNITRTWTGNQVEGWTDKEISEIYDEIASGGYAEPEEAAQESPTPSAD